MSRTIRRAFFGACALVSAAAGAGIGCSSSSMENPAPDGGAAGDTGAADAAAAAPCNGRAELCDRAYDKVAFPGTHNAYANIAQSFSVPDQSFPMSRQLADGVRVLHLEIQPHGSDADPSTPYLCHSYCELGGTSLADGLAEIKAFVLAHPDDVVTLLMESDGLATDVVGDVVTKSGLVDLLHQQGTGAPWPTLGAMTKSGKRVVAFLADLSKTGGTTPPWLHDRFAWTWETPWDNRTPADFARCDADRGAKGDPIYVVDTYREDQAVPTAAAAATVNVDPFLIDRVLTCQKAAGVLPNFVMVNYYEVGDLFHVVDLLNGFAARPSDDLSAFPPADWPGSTDAGAGGG